MRLQDKVAIITGAGSGMGEATALLFSKEGAAVVCMDVKNAEQTAAQIVQAGGKATAITADVSKLADWEKTVQVTLQNYGKVDILCNVAGIAEDTTIVETNEEEFDRVININLKGVALGMKVVIPEFLKRECGKIVNVASLGSHCGLAGLPNYCASKGGVIALTRQVAIEFARRNIQVNSVSPGLIITPMQEQASPEMLAAYNSAIPMGKMGEAIDIAYAVLFLSSSESNYITGTDLLVDGGWCGQ